MQRYANAKVRCESRQMLRSDTKIFALAQVKNGGMHRQNQRQYAHAEVNIVILSVGDRLILTFFFVCVCLCMCVRAVWKSKHHMNICRYEITEDKNKEENFPNYKVQLKE